MKTFLLGLFLLLLPAAAETRRALLVGINQYASSDPARFPVSAGKPLVPRIALDGPARRRSFSDLDGAWNDVESMRALLISRYGFRPENVIVLSDLDHAQDPEHFASANNVLDTFKAHLIQKAAKDDISFFYYAGHGSRVLNTTSNKYEETIVAADAPAGAADIRNKELLRLYRAALEKDVKLTAIFDSCHAGGMSRGSNGKSRDVAPDTRTVSDRLEFAETYPTDQGMLFLAAAEPEEKAFETRFQGKYYGAFSLALRSALQASGANESFSDIFQRLTASLRLNGADQHPTSAGNHRLKKGLFGQNADQKRGLSVAVSRVEPNGDVLLGAGLAVGLNDGCELSRGNVRIRIAGTPSLTESLARVISGNPASLATGDLVELERWTWPKGSTVTLYVGQGQPPAEADLLAFVRAVRTAVGESRWSDDPLGKQEPTHVLRWDRSGWELGAIDEKTPPVILGKTPDPHALGRELASSGRLFVELPPSRELLEKLDMARRAESLLVDLLDRRAEATYLLTGRVSDSATRDAHIEYRWTLRNAALLDPSDHDLPLSGCWASGSEAPAELLNGARKVARAQQLRNLNAVAGEVAASPYDLFLRDSASPSQLLSNGATTVGGNRYCVVLRTTPEARNKQLDNPLYLYVIGIESSAAISAIYPRSVNGPNKLVGRLAEEISTAACYTAQAPWGIDTFLVFASPNPLDVSDLEQTGLDHCGGERGTRYPAGSNWSVRRTTFVARPKP